VNAAVTLLEYGDFECPYYREGTHVARILQEASKGQLRFLFRHFPLTKHPHAQHAAEAAEIAAAHGKFWDMAAILFANQDELADRDLVSYAETLGLDGGTFRRDLLEHVYAERVQADILSGKQSGVTGTPTYFINSRRYDGEDDTGTLRAVLQHEIDIHGGQ
jgi:protein-disulfide isomerase